MTSFNEIERRARACDICRAHLPLPPRPVFQVHPSARILIVGQAPSLIVHETEIPWNDKSGDRLREWMGISRDIFYDKKKVAILPVGFCYPGKDKTGDKPPRKECFRLWHHQFLEHMPAIQLVVLLGTYAHAAFLGSRRKSSLTATVKAWREYAPKNLPLPHPSPLNNLWMHKNRWFEREVLPEVARRVHVALT